MTVYQTGQARGLQAIADPNDTIVQGLLPLIDAFWTAVDAAPGVRSPSAALVYGPLNQAIQTHIAGWARLKAMAATSTNTAAATAYQSAFTSANAMLTAAGASTVPFSFAQASNAAMIAALKAAATGTYPTPFVNADLQSMATTVAELWSPTLSAPAPMVFSGPVGDEEVIFQAQSAVERYLTWLQAGG